MSTYPEREPSSHDEFCSMWRSDIMWRLEELEHLQHDGANGSCSEGCRRCKIVKLLEDAVHDYCVNTARYAYTVDV